MTSATLYQITGGEVRKSIIPPAGLELPVSRRMDYRQPVVIRGAERPEWVAYTLDAVTEIASRPTPWCTWYCSPGKVGDTDREGYRTYGTAHVVQSVVWLSSNEAPTASIQSALHEAWHVAEDHLTLAEMDIVNNGIHSAPELPDGHFNDYYRQPAELRANAFMSWAYSYWLRGKLPTYYRGMAQDELVMTMVLRGDLGLRVARRGLIPAARMPEALHQRMAELGDGGKLIDAVRPLVMATWRGLRAAAEWFADAFRPDVVAPVVKGRQARNAPAS